MAIYVRPLRDRERKRLQEWARYQTDDQMRKRARVILLSAEGYTVPRISEQVGLHPINVRKWIHRFNEHGLAGLQSGKSPGRPPRFTAEQREQIIKIAQTDPQELGLSFQRWSLQRLREYLISQGIVDSISAETVRQILRSAQVTQMEESAEGRGKAEQAHYPPLQAMRGEEVSARVEQRHLEPNYT